MSQLKTLLVAALLLFCLVFAMAGCNVTATAGCYGYSCNMPYDYGFDAKRFEESGTRQPNRYYRPGYY